MAESPSSDLKKTQAEPPEFCGGTTGFAMMIVAMLTFFIMFNPDLRKGIAYALDGVFDPLFGFDDKYVILTLLCTSVFMVFFSTTIRHFMTDWVELARSQKFMSAYQKEKMDAIQTGNTVKLKKLEELSPQVQNMQMIQMAGSFKPLIFTMLFFIVVFPWLWMVYMERLEFDYLSLPWSLRWDFTPTLNICPGGGFRYWIFIYIVISFPIGFLIQNGLKYITFMRQIKRTEFDKERELRTEIEELEQRITESQDKGIPISRPQELISRSEQHISERKYNDASRSIDEAKSYLDRKTETNARIQGLITETETMINNAKNKGINITASNKSLIAARKAMKENDETSAIYYAKQSQRQVKDSRRDHKNAEEALSTVKAFMYDLREIDTKEADDIFDKALTAMENQDYATVVKHTKATKFKAEEIQNLNKEAVKMVDMAKRSMDAIQHLDLEVPGTRDLFDRAERALKNHEYKNAIDLATQCNEKVTAEKEQFQEAQESLSFAKLVISNAISFGATIGDAEKLVADGEVALAQKDYKRTIELATKAKDIAEQAKRQQQRISKRKL